MEPAFVRTLFDDLAGLLLSESGIVPCLLSRFRFYFQFALFVCLFVCSSVGWEGSLEGGEIGESGEGEAVVFASARVEVEGRHDG